MKFLIKEDFININKKTVQRHGGNFVPPFNFLNEGSLDFLLEAVNGEIFGEAMYPSISDKAAFYMHSIIIGHIFQDGNKRTGLEAALLFLKINDANLNDDLQKIETEQETLIPETGDDSESILINFTLEMASGILSLEECKSWFKENM